MDRKRVFWSRLGVAVLVLGFVLSCSAVPNKPTINNESTRIYVDRFNNAVCLYHQTMIEFRTKIADIDSRAVKPANWSEMKNEAESKFQKGDEAFKEGQKILQDSNPNYTRLSQVTSKLGMIPGQRIFDEIEEIYKK